MTKSKHVGRGRRFAYDLYDKQDNFIDNFTSVEEARTRINMEVPEAFHITLGSLNQMFYRNKETLCRGAMQPYKLKRRGLFPDNEPVTEQ